MIHAYMTANHTRTYVDHLPTLLASYNSIPHTTTGFPPVDLHTHTTNHARAQLSIQKKAVKKIRGSQRGHPGLFPNDTVRVAKTKATGLTRGAIKWSKETFTVVSVSQPSHEWSSPIYTLDNGRKYTRDKLQKIDLEHLVRIPPKPRVISEPIARVRPTPPLRPPSQRTRRANVTLRDLG